jgi:hypothetical protein
VSYYNFDDHFWSPQTVCGQSTLQKAQKKNSRRIILKNLLTIFCIAVWTPLLLQIPIPGENLNENQQTTLNTSNTGGERIFKRERFLFYLSTQQR